MNSLLETALDYAARGFNVIPIRPDDRKRPALPAWKPYQERRVTEEEMRRWFTGRANGIAVICGRVSSGLTIVDIDDPEVADDVLHASPGLLRSTFCVRTGGGNLHIYLRVPFPPAKFSLRRQVPPLPIDVQGEGSYVVMPPSLHASGRHYEWMSGCGQDVLEIMSFGVWFQCTLRRAGIIWTPTATRTRRPQPVQADSPAADQIIAFLQKLTHQEGRARQHEVWFNCPFHEDLLASVSANTLRPVWHCFGCGEGGGLAGLRKLHHER